MIHRTEISEDHVLHAIEHGEFPKELITAQKHVAVVLTQGWCPQWKSMDVWLSSSERKEEPAEYDLLVPCFIYDTSPLFKKFRKFKEKSWNNRFVPYIRYYRDGALIDESNYVPSREFFARFEDAVKATT